MPTRLDRERQILECLATGPQTITEMVRVMYADVAPELHEPAAPARCWPISSP